MYNDDSFVLGFARLDGVVEAGEDGSSMGALAGDGDGGAIRDRFARPPATASPSSKVDGRRLSTGAAGARVAAAAAAAFPSRGDGDGGGGGGGSSS